MQGIKLACKMTYISKDLTTVRLASVEEAHQLALRIEQQSRTTQPRRNMKNWGVLSPRNSTAAATRPSNTERYTSRGAPTPDRNVMEHDEKRKRQDGNWQLT